MEEEHELHTYVKVCMYACMKKKWRKSASVRMHVCTYAQPQERMMYVACKTNGWTVRMEGGDGQ